MRILFLYTELADYFLACCRELSLNAEVHIIKYPVNKEAPFKFQFGNLKVYEKKDFDLNSLQKKVDEINPDKIVVSGWIDKDYLKVIKKYHKKIPVIIAFDTQWRNDLKQKIACVLSPFFLLNRFSHAWVAGEKQMVYAEKLGFKKQNITKGFYSCDFKLYEKYFLSSEKSKTANFPKRFIYVGRYLPHKGINELWQAFIELSNEMKHDWELWCAGTGTVEPISHPKIKHLGFVQPEAMEEYVLNTGVFVLPSKFEPWGVVVHEFAASGFPLLLSEKVGAKEAFLTENENGFVFDPENINEIKNALKKIINLDDKKLLLMGRNSHESAKKTTPEIWSESLQNLV